jgi:hypothetical protein
MSFLDGYEDIAARIARFQKTFSTGRIETSIIDFSAKDGYILVEARVYRQSDDTLPAGIDYAFGHVSTYNVQMKKWYVEDTVSSAIGRCLNLVLGALNLPEGISNSRPTKQNMEQVEQSDMYVAQAIKEDQDDLWAISKDVGMPNIGSAIEAITDKIGAEVLAEAPRCQHGTRIWREGVSSKTGKAWANFSCTEKSKASQCDPLWYVMTSSGTWKPQV